LTNADKWIMTREKRQNLFFLLLTLWNKKS
jgi:hypothetical protein